MHVYLILLLFGNSTQRLNQFLAVGAILSHFYPLTVVAYFLQIHLTFELILVAQLKAKHT